MTFAGIYPHLLSGAPIKRVEFQGFWQYDAIQDDVLIFTRDGTETSLRYSNDLLYTLAFLMDGDWITVDPKRLLVDGHVTEQCAQCYVDYLSKNQLKPELVQYLREEIAVYGDMSEY